MQVGCAPCTDVSGVWTHLGHKLLACTGSTTRPFLHYSQPLCVNYVWYRRESRPARPDHCDSARAYAKLLMLVATNNITCAGGRRVETWLTVATSKADTALQERLFTVFTFGPFSFFFRSDPITTTPFSQLTFNIICDCVTRTDHGLPVVLSLCVLQPCPPTPSIRCVDGEARSGGEARYCSTYD